MLIVPSRTIELEHRVLRPTSIPEVSAARAISTESLVAKVIAAHASTKWFFTPTRSALEEKAPPT